MTFGQALRTCRCKFARFGGRASRAEYWYLVLAFVVANWVAGTLDYMFFDGRHPLGVFLAGIAFLPMTSAGWRRLHDVNRRGWWLLLPGIASLIFLVGAFVIRGLNAQPMAEIPTVSNSTGWLYTVMLGFPLVSLVSTIWLIVQLARRSDPQENRFGPVPQSSQGDIE
ncbi:DUF805 domain-containing protein [Rhodovulum sulfidophilum]|uniref:DUF805 domain-containing protein n=1 Tax=Rhodovulum sulfidophilum TaxID=35806 RepID=UPI000951813C|nr:DUF805 domain-containing protein [Rhodovulum sulfidophilum]OLS42685.1 hypothetical protein BV392_20320 [Rhodovulum sulfidophilum]